MVIICIEENDETLLDETLTNLLRRNKKKGKNVIRINKLNKSILKITNTVIGIDRIDLITINKEFFNFIAESRGFKNSIIYTCKNIYSVPVGLRCVTDFFALPIKKKNRIKLIIFRNTPVLEKLIMQYNLPTQFFSFISIPSTPTLP
jgi:hypothetical protein